MQNSNIVQNKLLEKSISLENSINDTKGVPERFTLRLRFGRS